MALVYVASLSLDTLSPIVYGAMGQVAISLNAALTGNLAVNASLAASPPTVATQIVATVDFATSLALALASAPPVPAISFSLSDCTTLSASLNASFGLLASLNALLDAAIGIYAFGYTGVASSMGAAVTSELSSTWPDGSPTNTSTTAFVFGAVSSISQHQLALFLDGLPFTGGLAYGGRIGLSSLSNVTAKATTQGNAGIGAQLAATASLQASLGVSVPTIAVTIGAVAKFLANLRAQVSLPAAGFALQATANAAASLSAKFGLLCALGAALERFDATFFVYTYSGLGNALGGALTTALASTWGDGTTPTSGACAAAILGATDVLTATTMGAFFGGA